MDTRDRTTRTTTQENYNEAHCSLGHVVNFRNPFSQQQDFISNDLEIAGDFGSGWCIIAFSACLNLNCL